MTVEIFKPQHKQANQASSTLLKLHNLWSFRYADPILLLYSLILQSPVKSLSFPLPLSLPFSHPIPPYFNRPLLPLLKPPFLILASLWFSLSLSLSHTRTCCIHRPSPVTPTWSYQPSFRHGWVHRLMAPIRSLLSTSLASKLLPITCNKRLICLTRLPKPKNSSENIFHYAWWAINHHNYKYYYGVTVHVVLYYGICLYIRDLRFKYVVMHDDVYMRPVATPRS